MLTIFYTAYQNLFPVGVIAKSIQNIAKSIQIIAKSIQIIEKASDPFL